ncbi:PIN domain-containing protein [Rhizobium sp. AQ_MP]|uniref:type II toxin-antitoxin system VapC family toxin n=1 Tax=Rhizobium sp. AQ_MP TaxID=2761536 RepID=UPI00163B401F|nr:PIN domain-containing protein [Rhizobium sp. AQ_MP]MBC2771284.1 PIN domain-containing protein [Rhizobium sp. AQ_MP]
MGRLMPQRHQLYLDTNAAILLIEGEGILREMLRDLTDRASSRPSAILATSALTVSELLVKPLRQNDTRLIEVYRAWGSGLPWLQIVPVSNGILDIAAQLRARRGGLKLPDAIHVASALAIGTTHFLTDDQGIANSVTVRTWEEPYLFEVCRLDAPSLTSLIESLTA